MTCKKCVHFKRCGHVSRCDLFDNIEVYGDVGNEPIKADCLSFKSTEQKPGPEKMCCHWRPIKKAKTKTGYFRFILQTDCGRVIEYSRGSKVGEEIMGERCAKCGRYIKVFYIGGME